MIKQNRIKLIILILYLVGVIIHSFCFTRSLALQLTTPFLLLINGLMIFQVLKDLNKATRNKTIIFLIAAFLITFIIEIVGSKTGAIFGSYTYGNSMVLKVVNVPVVIGLNWVVLLVSSYNLAEEIGKYFKIKSVFIVIILSAALLTFLDYFIEPVAIALDYWNWEIIRVPLRNYIAWFIISLCLTMGIQFFKINLKNTLLKYYYIVVLAYFILLHVFLQPC